MFFEALKKLKASQEYREFKARNNKAFLFSAFFILNRDFEIETQQFDFFVPKNYVAVFSINDKIQVKEEEFEPKNAVTKLNEKIRIDIDGLKEIIMKEMAKQKLASINKTIAILQRIMIGGNEVQAWHLICLFDNFKMLQIYVDCFNGNILKSEQANLFDFVKISRGWDLNP